MAQTADYSSEDDHDNHRQNEVELIILENGLFLFPGAWSVVPSAAGPARDWSLCSFSVYDDGQQEYMKLILLSGDWMQIKPQPLTSG